MTGLLEFAIACGVNFALSAGEHVVRRHIADRAVQAHGVVMLYVGLNQAYGVFPRQRGARADALGF